MNGNTPFYEAPAWPAAVTLVVPMLFVYCCFCCSWLWDGAFCGCNSRGPVLAKRSLLPSNRQRALKQRVPKPRGQIPAKTTQPANPTSNRTASPIPPSLPSLLPSFPPLLPLGNSQGPRRPLLGLTSRLANTMRLLWLVPLLLDVCWCLCCWPCGVAFCVCKQGSLAKHQATRLRQRQQRASRTRALAPARTNQPANPTSNQTASPVPPRPLFVPSFPPSIHPHPPLAPSERQSGQPPWLTSRFGNHLPDTRPHIWLVPLLLDVCWCFCCWYCGVAFCGFNAGSLAKLSAAIRRQPKLEQRHAQGAACKPDRTCTGDQPLKSNQPADPPSYSSASPLHPLLPSLPSLPPSFLSLPSVAPSLWRKPTQNHVSRRHALPSECSLSRVLLSLVLVWLVAGPVVSPLLLLLCGGVVFGVVVVGGRCCWPCFGASLLLLLLS